MEDEEAPLPAEVVAAAESVFEPQDDAAELSVLAQMTSLYQRDLAMATAFVVGTGMCPVWCVRGSSHHSSSLPKSTPQIRPLG